MKRLTPGLLLFLICLPIFLISTLPVRFGLKYLPENIPLQISGAQGSIWNGEAADIRWQQQSLGRFTWKLHALPLLKAELSTDFTLKGNDLDATGSARMTRNQTLQLTDTQLQVDLSALPLSKTQLLVTAEGKINAQIRSLHYADKLVQSADADFVWKPAHITSPVKYDLGEIELQVTGENAELQGILNSHNGPIKAAGILDLSPQGLFKADIKLTPNRTTPKELRDMLPLLGRPDSNGAVKLKHQMQIPNWPS
jgi:general secretion pathway protein N